MVYAIIVATLWFSCGLFVASSWCGRAVPDTTIPGRHNRLSGIIILGLISVS